MKAESFIYTGVQKPLTMLGLPPVLLALTGGCFCVTFALMVIMNLLVLALPVPLALSVVLFAFFYRRTRRDHHFFSLLAVPPRFWRGRKGRRLVAGRPAGNKARNTGGRS